MFVLTWLVPVARVERHIERGAQVRELVDERVGGTRHGAGRAQPLQLARRQRQRLRLRAAALAALRCTPNLHVWVYIQKWPTPFGIL